MIKAIKIAVLASFMGGVLSPMVQAQSSAAADLAAREAVRRQGEIQQLGKLLQQAKTVESTGNLLAASKLYEAAQGKVESVGINAKGIDVERAAAMEGLTRVRMGLADQYAKSGKLSEARKEVNRVLVLSPNNLTARERLQEIDAGLAKLRGRMPTEQAIEDVKSVVDEKIQASTLVQDGKLFYEMARYDKAESKLRQALKIDPSNRGASYYLVLVQEAKNKLQVKARDITSRDAIKNVTKDWVAPTSHLGLEVPNSLANISPTNTYPDKIYTGPGRIRIHRLLHNLKFDRFPITGSAEGISLRELVNELHDSVIELDEAVNFLIDSNTGVLSQPSLQDPSLGMDNDPFAGGGFQPQEQEEVDIGLEVQITIDPPLRHVSLYQVLEIMKELSNIPIGYSVKDYGIMFSHQPIEGPRLENRTYRVDPDTFMQGLQSVGVNYVSADAGMGGGMGGMGGGGMGGGGMGGGGMGGGMGMFSIPPQKVVRLPYRGVCLEHGKREPTSRMRYKLVPVEEYSKDAGLHELLRLVARGRVATPVAQAAAWNINNRMPWQALAAKRRTRLGGGYQPPFFHLQHLISARQVVAFAKARGAERQRNDKDKAVSEPTRPARGVRTFQSTPASR